jgi:hypothetical protein
LQIENKNENQPQFSDADLLAYLDGEIDPQLAVRIEASPADLKRTEELGSLQSHLTARLYRLECPKSETLGQYHLGMLDQEQAIGVARHLQECPLCSREMIQLSDFLSEPSPALSPSFFKGVQVIIAKLMSELGKRSITGEMAFAPALVELRGGPPGAVILEADDLLITLDFQPVQDERLTILGQVAAHEQDLLTGSSIELRQEGILKCSTTLDDLGAFRCEGLQPGLVELLLIPHSGPLVLANINLVV